VAANCRPHSVLGEYFFFGGRPRTYCHAISRDLRDMNTRQHDYLESLESTATMEDPRAPSGSTAMSLSGEVNSIQRLNLTHWVSLPINLSTRKLPFDAGVVLRHWNPCTKGGQTDHNHRIRNETVREMAPTPEPKRANAGISFKLHAVPSDDEVHPHLGFH
jgi:hypothetical protein